MNLMINDKISVTVFIDILKVYATFGNLDPLKQFFSSISKRKKISTRALC